MIVALDNLILELEERVDLAVKQTKIMVVHVIQGISQGRELGDLLIQVLLVHERVEKTGCIRFERKLFVELLEHFVEQDLDIELSLQPVN